MLQLQCEEVQSGQHSYFPSVPLHVEQAPVNFCSALRRAGLNATALSARSELNMRSFHLVFRCIGAPWVNVWRYCARLPMEQQGVRTERGVERLREAASH